MDNSLKDVDNSNINVDNLLISAGAGASALHGEKRARTGEG